MSRRGLEVFKGKAPQLVALVIAVVVIAIIMLDILEDSLVEGGTFTGAPFDLLLNAIIMFTQNVTATVSSWGYVGIFSLMLLESTSLPLPSEVILPFSGYLVSLGQLSLWITILISTIAAITGSLIDYYIGLKGFKLISRQKTLEKLLFSKANLERAEKWFDKYGSLSVFLGRMIPGFRTFVSFPAGAVKMSLLKFITYTLVGCLAWNSALVYVGMYVGENWREVPSVSHYLIVVLLAAILVTLAVFWIRAKKRT